jgi:putative addiction module component (TIGR02574 family)
VTVSGVLDALKREAAKLNDAERAQLAAWIIESLEPSDEGFDLHEEWAAEIERRLTRFSRASAVGSDDRLRIPSGG